MNRYMTAALTVAVGAALSTRADASEISGDQLLRFNAREGGVAEVMIYGTIGSNPFFDSLSAQELVEQIEASEATELHVRINSKGGDVVDGIAVYNALREHSARKVVWIDGQAASIASLIAMAGDEVVAYPTSLVMVHAPHTIAAGNAASYRRLIEALEAHSTAMLEAYADKTGKRGEVKELLDDGFDHWYTAEAAHEFGFVDRVAAGSGEPKAESAAVVALAGYLGAISVAPSDIAATLRGHICSALTPTVFASLPEVSQQAVIGQLEDPTMKQHYQRIYANAGSNPAPAPAAPVVATPAAPAPVGADPAQQDEATIRASAVQALQARNADIRALAEPHFGNSDVRAYYDEVIANADPAVTADDVGRRILALLANGAGPLNGQTRATAGADQRDQTRTAMQQAIMARAGLETAEGGNPYRGHTMTELARACLTSAGVRTDGLERREIVGLAFTHSSSDFPGLLGDSARKAVARGYEEAPETYPEFTRPVSVSDFKPTTLAGLGAFSDLLEVPEGGEFKYGTFSEQSQMIRLVTFGRLFSITRQAVINDDLSVFSEVPRKMGQAARRTVGKAVFELLTSNPMLADGLPLFHANRGNLLSAAGITTASVDAMRAAMATQRDPDGNPIRVPLRQLLAPVALGGQARVVRDSQTEVGGTGNKNNTVPNSVRGTFEVVDDPRLDANSSAAWYGIADPAIVDSIVIAYLDGNQTPYLEEKEGFTVDGVAWKVRLDAAPTIVDYRGLAFNPGE